MQSFFFFLVLVGVIGTTGVHAICEMEETLGMKATTLDYICYFVGGPRHIPDKMYEMYMIPVLWIFLQVLIGYMVGYYAMTDIDTYGQQVLLRSGSRRKWWFSKCVWNSVTVIGLYVIIYGAAVLSGVIGGAGMKMKLTGEIVTSVCNVDTLGGTTRDHCIILLFMPMLVSLALSMMQMTITLISSPIIGFISTQSIVFLSTLFENKVLFSNYGMLTHNRVTCGSEIVWQQGIILCVGIYIVAAAFGMTYFVRYNILPKVNQE